MVDIMEFVFILAIRFIQMLCIKLLKGVQIIGILRIHTFMYNEVSKFNTTS